MRVLGSGLLALLCFLAGCATSSARLNDLRLGMNRAEVFAALGRPHATSADGETEFLTYNMLNRGMGNLREYTVKLVAGRVTAFGEREDFGQQRFVPVTAEK